MDLDSEIKNINKDRTYRMASFISLFIGLQGTFMTVLSVFTSNLKMVIISMTYAILMYIVFFVVRKTKKLTFFYIMVTFIVFGLELSFLVIGGTEGFGVIWMTVVPIFSVYLLDFRKFFALNFSVFLILAIGLWTPVNQFVYDFNHSFELRFPVTYLVSFVFGLFLKHRIQTTEKVLEQQTYLLEREIERAAAIQKNYYNQPAKEYEKWDLGCIIKPMASVTGDLYDIYCRETDLDGIGIFDVSGHGISSGLITMLAKNIIHQEFYDSFDYDISETMERINKRIISEKGKIDNYMTGILIKIQDNCLDLVNAGHPYPLLYRRKTNEIEILKKLPESRGMIGIEGVPTLYATQFIDMEPGDEIVLYTDGVTDAKNQAGENFKLEKMISIIKENVELPAQEQTKAIISEIKQFRGDAEPTDDIALMILKKK